MFVVASPGTGRISAAWCEGAWQWCWAQGLHRAWLEAEATQSSGDMMRTSPSGCGPGPSEGTLLRRPSVLWGWWVQRGMGLCVGQAWPSIPAHHPAQPPLPRQLLPLLRAHRYRNPVLHTCPLIHRQSSPPAWLIQLPGPQMGTKQRDRDQQLLLIMSAWLKTPQPGVFTALGSICPCVINYTALSLTSGRARVRVGAGQGPSPLPCPSA